MLAGHHVRVRFMKATASGWTRENGGFVREGLRRRSIQCIDEELMSNKSVLGKKDSPLDIANKIDGNVFSMGSSGPFSEESFYKTIYHWVNPFSPNGRLRKRNRKFPLHSFIEDNKVDISRMIWKRNHPAQRRGSKSECFTVMQRGKAIEQSTRWCRSVIRDPSADQERLTQSMSGCALDEGLEVLGRPERL